MIKRVQQEEMFGCGPAVLAMLVRISYTDAKAYFDNAIDFAKSGTHTTTIDGILADLGYAVARKYKYRGFRMSSDPNHSRDIREPWPPEPFADVHLCQVEVYEKSPAAHFVILLRDGSVIDPLFPEKRNLTDYFRINNVGAVTKIVAWDA